MKDEFLYAPYSYSKLSTHDFCNRKFKYAYVDKVKVPFVYNEALIKGGAIHDVLEKYPNKSSHKSADKYLDIAIKFILSDLGSKYLKSDKVAEMSFGLDKDFNPCTYGDKNAVLRGYIDHVCVVDGLTHIVDWKTGRYKNEKYQSYEQLMLYAVYFFKRYNTLQEIKVSYVYVEHNLENTMLLNRKYLDVYIDQLKKLITNAEEDKVFAKNPTRLCDWCDWQEHCNGDS